MLSLNWVIMGYLIFTSSQFYACAKYYEPIKYVSKDTFHPPHTEKVSVDFNERFDRLEDMLQEWRQERQEEWQNHFDKMDIFYSERFQHDLILSIYFIFGLIAVPVWCICIKRTKIDNI
jgi:hypothetical protein